MQKKNLIKRFFWIIGILFATAIMLAFGLIYKYEDKIKAYSIKQINKSINARIDVEKIDMSFFSQFPKASLDFYNVGFYDNSEGSKNTLAIITSDKIFLSFDIIELLSNTYNLQEIVIENAQINLEIYKNGENNFSFLSSKNENDSSEFLLNLNAVKFVNTKFNYNNKATNQRFQFLIKNAIAKGVFSDSNFGIDLKGKTILNYFYNQKRLIVANKSIDLDVSTKLDIEKDNYVLKKGLLTYDGIPLKLSGGIQVYKNSIGINAKLNGKMLKFGDIKNNISRNILDKIEKYNIEGLISLDVNIGGRFGGKYKPHLSANASLDNFKINYDEYNIVADNISMRIKYNNGKKNNLHSSSVVISKLNGKSNIGDFEGKIEVKNLWAPRIKAEIKGNWQLAELNKSLSIDTVSLISGNAATHSWLSLNLNYVEEEKQWIISNLNFDNNFNIELGELQFKNSEITYSNINSKGRLENNKIIIYNLNTIVDGSKLSAVGSIYNLPYGANYRSSLPLNISLSLNAEKLSYETIMAALPKSSDTSDSRFSNELDIEIDINAKEFAYNNINASNVSGRFIMRNRRLSFFNLKGNIFDGYYDGMLWIDGSKKGKYELFSKGITKSFDISKSFDTFNNFGQQTITSKNISGAINANYELSCSFDPKWNIDANSIELSSDMIIKNGVLRNVKALNALKSYTKIDDFSELKFSEISNNISVHNSQLLIPQMAVNSNKMNIELSGLHNFDNSYEYHFTVLLSEVMGKKYNKALEGEFGEVQNDGYGRTKLFIALKGKGSDFDVEYDRSGLAKKIKSDLQEEKSSLKKALNEEFGWFKEEEKSAKKDSVKTPKQKKKTDKENIKKQEEGEFIIEWDDE